MIKNEKQKKNRNAVLTGSIFLFFVVPLSYIGQLRTVSYN